MKINRSELVQAMLAEEVPMLRALLDEANIRYVCLEERMRQELADKDDVIRQQLAKSRDDAITIARLRLRCENEAALSRAIATRDARAKGLAEVAQYGEDCRRTADYQR